MASGSSGLNISASDSLSQEESSEAQRQSSTSSGSAATEYMEDQFNAEMDIKINGPKDKMRTDKQDDEKVHRRREYSHASGSIGPDTPKAPMAKYVSGKSVRNSSPSSCSAFAPTSTTSQERTGARGHIVDGHSGKRATPSTPLGEDAAEDPGVDKPPGTDRAESRTPAVLPVRA